MKISKILTQKNLRLHFFIFINYKYHLLKSIFDDVAENL